MENIKITPFQIIYNRFFSKITDDMYMEMTIEETEASAKSTLINSLGNFEFPRFPLYDYDEDAKETDDFGVVIYEGRYNCLLTREEVDILSDLMMIEWVRIQIASIENTRMKYSGSDFKFTSQANHIDKLLKMKKDLEAASKKKQRLYKRRKILPTGEVSSNWSGFTGGVLNGRRN